MSVCLSRCLEQRRTDDREGVGDLKNEEVDESRGRELLVYKVEKTLSGQSERDCEKGKEEEVESRSTGKLRVAPAWAGGGGSSEQKKGRASHGLSSHSRASAIPSGSSFSSSARIDQSISPGSMDVSPALIYSGSL